MQPGDGGGGGIPHPVARATHAQVGERGGQPEQAARNPRVHPGGGEGWPPQTTACAPRACHAGEGGGEIPNQEREGGAPHKQERTPFVHGLIQEMGGGALYLQIHPTARQRGSEGKRIEHQTGQRHIEGAPPPLGERGTPEDQVHPIIDHIVNSLPGRSSPSGQAPVPQRRQTRPSRGGRVPGDQRQERRRKRRWREGGQRGTGHQEPTPKKGGYPRGGRERRRNGGG